jgi:hypothetical protein
MVDAEQLDWVEELEEDEAEDDGVYVLVKIVENELGIGLSVPNDEPNGDYFMHVIDSLYKNATIHALENLIESCKRSERNVLAKEIRAFLDTPKTLH